MKAEATLGVGCGGAFSFAVSANALVVFLNQAKSSLLKPLLVHVCSAIPSKRITKGNNRFIGV